MSDNIFDKLAKNYFEVHRRSLSIFSNMDLNYFIRFKLDIVKSEIKKSRSSEPVNILDFGCGIGESTLYISEIFPNSKIIGIDLSSSSIEIAKKRKIKNTQFFSCNIINENIDNFSFDLIFISDVFQHIFEKDRAAVFSRLYSFLNKGGKIFIFEHNPWNPVTALIYKTTEIDNGCTMISSREFDSLIKKLNLQDIKIYPSKYLIFMPRYTFLKKIFFLEKFFQNIPIGAKYYKVIEKL